MRVFVLLCVVASFGCESQPSPVLDAGTAVGAAPVDAGVTASGSGADALVARAAVTGKAGDWREAGDALAKAGRRAEAGDAYDKCAEAAGDDFEASLYCQAAAAVARKVKPKKP